MGSQHLALEPGGPKRLSVTWTGDYQNVKLALDGQPLVAIDPHSLEHGRSLTLPDGSVLHVQRDEAFVGHDLHISRDGMALPGSDGDPVRRVRTAATTLIGLGAYNVIAGAVALGTQPIVFGAIFVVLGFAVRQLASQLAVGVAFLVLAGVTAWGIPQALSLIGELADDHAAKAVFSGLLFRLTVLALLARGFFATRDLAYRRAAAARPMPAPAPVAAAAPVFARPCHRCGSPTAVVPEIGRARCSRCGNVQ